MNAQGMTGRSDEGPPEFGRPASGEQDAPVGAQGEGTPIHFARGYDLSTEMMYFGSGPSFRQRILDLGLLKRGEGFLDIGCGPGRLVCAAARRVGSLGGACGVDLSPQMIHLARSRAQRRCPAAEFQQAPAQHLPFDDDYFDVVTSVFMIHHVPGDAQKHEVFKEVHRVLRKGGRFVIVDFASRDGLMSHLMGGHLHDSTIEEYPGLLRWDGFHRGDTGVVNLKFIKYVRSYAD